MVEHVFNSSLKQILLALKTHASAAEQEMLTDAGRKLIAAEQISVSTPIELGAKYVVVYTNNIVGHTQEEIDTFFLTADFTSEAARLGVDANNLVLAMFNAVKRIYSSLNTAERAFVTDRIRYLLRSSLEWQLHK